MMLKSVLGDYLDNIKERDLDFPFLTLLPRLDFFDIHFTHGQVEFGKDFIAKRSEDGCTCLTVFICCQSGEPNPG